jgi:hypothetical protein
MERRFVVKYFLLRGARRAAANLIAVSWLKTLRCRSGGGDSGAVSCGLLEFCTETLLQQKKKCEGAQIKAPLIRRG